MIITDAALIEQVEGGFLRDVSLGYKCVYVQRDDGTIDYQEERLIRSLRDRFEQGADAMADSVLRDVARFRRTRPPVDDMTLLILRRRG